MTQQDARNFILALNNIAGFVPPMFFQPLSTSVAAKLIQDVANGEATIDVKPVEPKPAA